MSIVLSARSPVSEAPAPFLRESGAFPMPHSKLSDDFAVASVPEVVVGSFLRRIVIAVDVLADEADGSVTQQKVGSAGMLAAERDDRCGGDSSTGFASLHLEFGLARNGPDV